VDDSTTTTITSAAEEYDVGPLRLRIGHSVVWTGEEMVVWGGEVSDGGMKLGDGAAFDPVSATWRSIAASPLAPRNGHIGVWAGEEMLIVGGRDERDAAAYDPVADTWRPIASAPIPRDSFIGTDESVGWVWNGTELVVWDVHSDDIAAYDPNRDVWRMLPEVGIDGDTAVLRWAGDLLYAFADSGLSYPSDTALGGARLNQEGGWEPVPSAEFSTESLIIGADATLTAWAGDRFIAWSSDGSEGKTLTLVPGADAWTETDPVPIPPCEGQGEPIQAGDLVVAFGWCGTNIAVLDPSAGRWTSDTVTDYPTAGNTVWTGDEILNWGAGDAGISAWRYPLS
jgi:hypothetical protein